METPVFLPLDIIFEIEGKELPANSLLFKAASPFFADSIENQYKNGNNRIVLNGVSLDLFKIIEEFIVTHEVVDLWKKNQNELKEIRKNLSRLKMNALGKLCETVLKRYIDRDNVLATLVESHKNGWQTLRHASFEYINNLSFGILFHPAKPSILAFEFLDFNERSLAVFEVVKSLITHFIAKKKIPESIEFKSCLQKCVALVQLNISTSLTFSEFIFEAANSLEELDLSSCAFLDASILGRILSYFKDLKFLNLSDNNQLNYTSFTHLSKLKDLLSLNISKNPQIGDEDFRLIIQSVPKVIDLDCSDCKSIGDTGFFELGKGLRSLIFLNLSRDEISDGLLIELGARSLFLEEINLMRCKKLSSRGILEFVKQARALKQLTLEENSELFLKIKQEKPHLTII
ncbi:MAG TPA: BTB/POZ domain-containing protein [Parachlamydiaceae bacterium]|nr:BTB/POZ domain-containing protein [Parachlamydiaceae bacterium]